MGKWTVLIGMMIVGLALRLAALDKQSLWLDEAYSLQVAEASVSQIATGAVGDRHTPPLYYLLLHFWARLGRDELWLRLPSALLGVLAIPVIFVLGRALISERIGWIAGALLTVSPFHLYYSQEARMYTLLMLLVMGGRILFLEGHRRRWSAVVGGVRFRLRKGSSSGCMKRLLLRRRPARVGRSQLGRDGSLQAAMVFGGMAHLPTSAA